MLRFILIDMSHPSSLFKTFSKERNIYNLLIKCKQNWLKFILQQLSKKHGLDYWKSKKVYMYKLQTVYISIHIFTKKYCSILLFNILHSYEVFLKQCKNSKVNIFLNKNPFQIYWICTPKKSFFRCFSSQFVPSVFSVAECRMFGISIQWITSEFLLFLLTY